MRFILLSFILSFILGIALLSPARADDKGMLHGYTPVTVQSLLELYWKAGILKVEDDQAVTEYIQIAACDTYKARHDDDFAWPELMKATRRYLGAYKDQFQNRFVIVQPIVLDRYDPEKQSFTLTPDTDYVSVKRMFFADYAGSGRLVCGAGGTVSSSPMRAVIALAAPFTLKDIPLESTSARALIDYFKSRSLAGRLRPGIPERTAYVRFYYTVHAFEAVDDGKDQESVFRDNANRFTGVLDGYDITADQDGGYPIYREMRDKK